ncbi:hypothetical protein [Streptomyces sp. VNUA24]|uniref:hypothetical protein n=1 Tax=Streptomyces sp. VNUA24 TaxID=3031131 RepID=UPI0023B81ECB|nr:hypothetical protein [Streptomyces sp. VNUA24]WEH17713.1 hypothetical protein PYR72_30175 [Streptomyces sp. VNUA24]
MSIKLMKRRKAMLTAAGMAAGALFALAVPGTAEAQSGSRICGNYWTGYYANGQKEVTWSRVIEVPKSDGVACDVAINRTDRVGNPPQETVNLGVKWGSRQRLQNVTCEWYSQDVLNSKHGDDVCNSMLRADNVFEVKNRTISQFYVKS